MRHPTHPARCAAAALLPILAALAAAPAAASELEACLAASDLLRVARVLAPDGRPVYARVTEQRDGHITRVAAIAPDGTPLVEVFARGRAAATPAVSAPDFPVGDDRVCSAVRLPEEELDAERLVIVSTGLNYAAHAEEAGGGDVFLFPKPAAPTAPYLPVHAPAGTTLLDYEVELAFVLLADVDPFDPPSRAELLANSAFFLSNDVSNREPIVRHAKLSGPSTGFPEGKGQPGFFPAGPWLVRGSELEAAREACGAAGLGLRLWVDDEAEPRQDSSTERMILPPEALVARIGGWIEEHGRRSTMPFRRAGEDEARYYPLAVPEEAPLLPAGSVVQTGTPDGVALHAPSPMGVLLRGAIRLRGPFAQFLAEEKERQAAGGTKYLESGSVVRARIDGLGEQRFAIGPPGEPAPAGPCEAASD